MKNNLAVKIKFNQENIKKEITPEGYLINYDVPIARLGLFTYLGKEFGLIEGESFGPNDPVVVLRNEESFNPEVLKSVENAPFTNDHPNSLVKSDNATAKIVGTLGDKAYMSGADLYINQIVVYDKKTVEEIENGGKKEVSIGFEAHYDWTQKGNLNGSSYDGIETIMRVNHLSLVGRGKAGPKYRLNEKKEKDTMSEKSLEKLVINGVEMEVTPESFARYQYNELNRLSETVVSINETLNKLTMKVNEMEKDKDDLENKKHEAKNKEDEKKKDESDCKGNADDVPKTTEQPPAEKESLDIKKNSVDEEISDTLKNILFGKNSDITKKELSKVSNLGALANQVIDGNV